MYQYLTKEHWDRSQSLGASNSHTKRISRFFLQIGLFLGFFSLEIRQFWSTRARIGKELQVDMST